MFWQLFAGHFDTSVGPKVESSSYMNIVKKLECRSEDVLFLTDMPRGKMQQYLDFIGALRSSRLQCLTSIF
jgi:methionine salvage enolase-phosphatase E1